ncbi:hypothetical protein FRC02_010671 [Tulasnella sp. 418]|nr:hypothetical protein FRC02_010671 [Tulasnella sp. 418]
MSQPNDIPRFTGEESTEEAERWFSMLIASTGGFGEWGIFRLIQNKFPVGSTARAWFDGLDETATTSWKVFEPKFYHQWIATKEQQKREAFMHHNLSEDMIFEKDTSAEVGRERIRQWVDHHQQLAESMGQENRFLFNATKQLIPPFIKAYLQAFVKSEPQSFEILCNEIKGITVQILEYEHLRRGSSVMNGSLVSARDLRQMAEKVDRFINTVGQGDSKDQYGLGCTSSESINWESCSSLTSIYSGTATSIGSQSSTPMVKPIALPDTLAGSRENIDLAALNGNTPPHDNFSSLYAIPVEWRKPTCLKTRNELIVIAQDAISFIENYGESIMVQKCQRRSFKSAIAIRERMIRSRRYLDSWPFEEYGYDGVYDDLMLTMARVYSYYAFQTAHYRMQPVYDWSGYVDSNDPTRNIVRHDRVMIHVSGCDHYLHLSSSGVPSLLGGLFAPNLERDNITISSAKTVMFMTISSYIAEFTGDKKHTDIAILAANCIKSWMLDSATSLIKDSLVDALTAQERSGSEFSCHLTGMTIEGFTVLASVTGDDGWRTL